MGTKSIIRRGLPIKIYMKSFNYNRGLTIKGLSIGLSTRASNMSKSARPAKPQHVTLKKKPTIWSIITIKIPLIMKATRIISIIRLFKISRRGNPKSKNDN
jgi:hypothetical protein